MHDENLDIFNESLSRCINDPEFMDNFYRLFIGESDLIRDYFKNTDMDKQKKMLLHSLANMVIAFDRPEILSDVATRHDAKNLNIVPSLYVIWLDCLIQAAKISDPLFDADIERSWRIVMQNGIDYLIGQQIK